MLLIAAAIAATDPEPARAALLAPTRGDALACHDDGSGAIVVCGHAGPSPYRLRPLDPRFAPHEPVSAGRGSLVSGAVGATGAGSCSTAGGGGATGCSLAAARAWGAWKAEEKRDGRPFPW